MITMIPKGDINTSQVTFPKVSISHIQNVGYIIRTFPKEPVGYITITFLKGPIAYITITFPKGPVGYTISTDDIIPPKEKSRLQTTFTKYPRQINKTKYIN